MSKRVSSITELVAALGGTAKAARWAGVTQAAISHWTTRGFIPAGWHLRLFLEAERQEIEVDPAVFGLKGNEPLKAQIEQRIRAKKVRKSRPKSARAGTRTAA